MSPLRLLMLSILVAFAAIPVAAQVVCPDSHCVHVDVNAGNCSNAGPGSAEVPLCSIQGAYDFVRFSTFPDGPDCPNTPTDCKRFTIFVQPGTYVECIQAFDPGGVDRPVRLLAAAWLEAGQPGPLDPGFDDAVDDTTIDGDGLCNFDGSRMPTLELHGTGARVEGFKITKAGKSGVRGRGSVAISHNLVTQNESNFGGGIYFYTGTCEFAGDIVATIDNNKVIDNHSFDFDPLAPGQGDGGGIAIKAEDKPTKGCLGGTSDVVVSDNIVRENSARNVAIDPMINDDQAQGGGIFAQGQTDDASQQTRVTITRNLIAGNLVEGGFNFDLETLTGYGGGIFASTFGKGTEIMYITDNTIGPDDSTNPATPSNFANGNGGGISAQIQLLTQGVHELVIDGNDIVGNTAGLGAGIDLLVIGENLNSTSHLEMVVSSNTISENESDGDGAGMYVEVVAEKTQDRMDDPEDLTLPDEVSVTIRGNEISDNVAGLGGGGALLRPVADADPDSGPFPACDPFTERSVADIDFIGNLVVGNSAKNLDPDISGDFVGAGILITSEAFGDAEAVVRITNSTIAGNFFDPCALCNGGFVGGIEMLSANFDFDCPSNNLGTGRVVIDRSIVEGNEAAGIGGVFDPVEGVEVSGTASVGNGDENYESFFIFPDGPPSGNFFETTDPGMSASYMIPYCSPVFFVGTCEAAPATVCFGDGLGDGACAAEDTCNYTGAGHQANPDSNYDGQTDGVDILHLAVSFGSDEDGVRFDDTTDLNRNGVTDPIDLVFMANEFGGTCDLP